MASITLIQQNQQQQQPGSFKKTSTPLGKRKIATVLDLENVENRNHQHLSRSPAKQAAVSLSTPPIISSSQMPQNLQQPVVVTVKKAFTGANVNVAALNNQVNIINNQQQQPKARTGPKVHTTPKSITNPSEETQVKSVKAALPQAVARRNARERNRVKQVNNGFAALRQHIPEEMAEAYELQKGPAAQAAAQANANSSAAKKLSKVETLRMAVEYIRNLETMLNLSGSSHANDHSFSFCDTSSIVSNSPSSPSFSNSSMIDEEPSLHHQQHPQTAPILPFDCDSLPIDQSHVVLPSVTTINGVPYLRLPPNHQTNLGQGFIDPESGDFILVSTAGDGDQHQQQVVYQTGMDHPQQQQPIILYAPGSAASPPQLLAGPNNFQSNFVSNNLLAPAYLQVAGGAGGVGGVRAEEFNGSGDDEDECSSGQSASPVPVNVLDGDRIKIEQQPSRGGGGIHSNCPSSAAYVNKSPLIRHVEEESPPKRLCTNNEQFSVVDQSGVIIRGNFIEIKQEHHQPMPQFSVDRSSPEILAPAADSMYDNIHERLTCIKTELQDDDGSDLDLLESGITEENMIDAMEWWENEKRSASN